MKQHDNTIDNYYNAVLDFVNGYLQGKVLISDTCAKCKCKDCDVIGGDCINASGFTPCNGGCGDCELFNNYAQYLTSWGASYGFAHVVYDFGEIDAFCETCICSYDGEDNDAISIAKMINKKLAEIES